MMQNLFHDLKEHSVTLIPELGKYNVFLKSLKIQFFNTSNEKSQNANIFLHENFVIICFNKESDLVYFAMKQCRYRQF